MIDTTHNLCPNFTNSLIIIYISHVYYKIDTNHFESLNISLILSIKPYSSTFHAKQKQNKAFEYFIPMREKMQTTMALLDIFKLHEQFFFVKMHKQY